MVKASTSSNKKKEEKSQFNESKLMECIKYLYKELNEKEKEIERFRKVALHNEKLFDKSTKKLYYYKKEDEKKEKLCIYFKNKIEKKNKEISNLLEAKCKLQEDNIEKDKKILLLSENNHIVEKNLKNSIRHIEELNKEIAILKNKHKNLENDNNIKKDNDNELREENKNTSFENDNTIKKDSDNELREENKDTSFENDNTIKKDNDNELREENKDTSFQNRHLIQCGLALLEQCDHENSIDSEISSNEEDNTSMEITSMIQLECGCCFHKDCLSTFKTIYEIRNNIEPEEDYCPLCNLD